jgi:hypothetical protein
VAQSDPDSGADRHLEEYSLEEILAEARGPIEEGGGEPIEAPATPDDKTVTDAPPGQVDLRQAAPEGTAPEDKGDAPPSGDGSEVLSALPDGLREKIATLDFTDEQLKELNDGFLRRADYTRKTQGISEAEKAAEAWKSLWEDPEAAAALHELQARRARGEGAAHDAPDDDDFDPDTATKDEWLAFMDRREKRLKEELLAPAKQQSAEDQKQQELLGALDAIRRERGMSEDDFAQAVAKARTVTESVGKRALDWEIDKLDGILKPFLGNGKPPAASPATPSVPQSAGGSPSGRSTAPSRPQRAWEAEKRQPATPREEDEAVLDILEQRYGRKFSREDLEDAARR